MWALLSRTFDSDFHLLHLSAHSMENMHLEQIHCCMYFQRSEIDHILFEYSLETKENAILHTC